MATTPLRRRLGALGAVVLVASVIAGVELAASAGAGAGSSFTRCEDLPGLWSAAHEINYDPQARTVTFIWEDDQATMRDTDRGCSTQPGLDGELRGSRDGWLASERASCQDLRNLVDAVRAERRAQGKTTTGEVPVSDQAAEAAARKTPSGAQHADSGAIAAKNRAAGQRMLDLDRSDAVLAKCP